MLDRFLLARAKAVNLHALVGQATIIKPVASTDGGEYAGPCPFCGGRDRFRVQPDHPNGGRWLCRNCTEGKWQDAIAYVMRRDAVSFLEACSRLGGSAPHMINRTNKPQSNSTPMQKQQPIGVPHEAWQTKARAFIAASQERLWSSIGNKARAWLNIRGLQDETVKKWRLGYNPQECFEPYPNWGLSMASDGKRQAVWLPRGIVIPCEIKNEIWYVKIRRAEAEPKLVHVKLPEFTSGVALFGANSLCDHTSAVLCEGEFDAMLLEQEAGDLVGVATFGSASLASINFNLWSSYLLPVARFLIAFDEDGKSERGAEALCSLSARMRRIQIPCLGPGDKDLTDFHKSGGRLRDWLRFELAKEDFLMRTPSEPKVCENPLQLHAKFAPGILAAIQYHERRSGCTWAEILRAVETVRPELVLAYHAAYEATDCDIYGKWSAHQMQSEDLLQFRENLRAWQDAVKQLLDCHADLSKDLFSSHGS